MRHRPTLSTKLLAMGTAFLLVALASIGFTLWVTWKLEGGAAAVNEAGRLRMNMLRMVLAQQEESPEKFAQLVQRFDTSLELLRTGDPARPLFVPWSDATRAHYHEIVREWRALRADWSAQPPGGARHCSGAMPSSPSWTPSCRPSRCRSRAGRPACTCSS